MGLTNQKLKNSDQHKIEQIHADDALSTLTDSDLWTLFKKGHEGAFKFIYTKYFNDLYNYGYHFCKDRELVKDAIQDLFIDLRKSAENLSDTDHIKFYLFKSLKWKIGNLNKRKNKLIKPDPNHPFHMNFMVSQETILINNQLDQSIKRLIAVEINRLPRRQKEAIYYFYFEGFSYQELTNIMKLGSVKASRNLIYKAISSLKSSETLQSKKAIEKLF